jgi:hypothetical protein
MKTEENRPQPFEVDGILSGKKDGEVRGPRLTGSDGAGGLQETGGWSVKSPVAWKRKGRAAE